MAYGPCPSPRELCPYFERPAPEPLAEQQEHGCFSDVDHIVPRRLGQTALGKTFIQLPDNKQQICRYQHEQKPLEPDELPPREYMVERVREAWEAGDIYLSKRKQRKIFGND